MHADSIQSVFLEQIRQRTPPGISFADELAEVLSVSRDSAYRRIRGETVLSLDEVKAICNKFRVSLDALLSQTNEMVTFQNRAIDPVHFPFEVWIRSVLSNLEMISSFPEKELIYFAKDIPFFHYFKVPELARFKMFFWMKTYHRYPQFASTHYKPELISKDLQSVGERLWDRYTEIPCIEIWSEETCNVTLRQIEYYLESGFITMTQALELCDHFSQLINTIKESASTGNKDGKARYMLYKNDILIAETSILFKMGDKKVSFITYNTMNILTTSQESFCHYIENHLTSVVNSSILISTTGEKERYKFFNQVEEKVLSLKERIV